MSIIKKVGITGGIGSGKSEVRKILADRGYPVIDADSLSKRIAGEDARARVAIKTAFGPDVFSDDGLLQRQLLARRAFADRLSIQRLNAILHPLVFENVDCEVEKAGEQGHPFIFIEAALFYETGWDKDMDAMLMVDAPLERRFDWLQQRDAVGRAQIEHRMRFQISNTEKRQRADFIIDNNGELTDLQQAVSDFLSRLK